MFFSTGRFQGWRQYLAVFVCTLSVGFSATGLSFFEPLMLRMDEEFDLSPSESSWLVSSVEIGEVVATIPAGILGDSYGRKTVLLLAGPIGLLGFSMLLFSKSIYSLYATRLLQGTVLAIVFALVPLYIAEIAEPNVRGLLAGQFHVMWAFGLLFTYMTGPYLSLSAYSYVCMIMPLAFSGMFFFMPESPYYLLMKKREIEADEKLVWLRGTKETNLEFDAMKKSVVRDTENKASWKELFSTGKARKTFFTVQVLCFTNYMIGSPALATYASKTFSFASFNDKHSATIILGVVILFSAFFGSFLPDKLGRRPLLIWTFFLIGVSFSFTAIYFYVMRYKDVSGYTWVLYLSIALSLMCINIGPNALMQTIQGELFPSNTSAIGSALTGITTAFANYLDIKQYQTVLDLFGPYMNFVIFAAFAYFGSIFIFFTLRETAGKSLGEIQGESDIEETRL